MKFLVDEQLSQMVAEVLSIVRRSEADEFIHIYDISQSGALDEIIPGLCSDNDCHALITSNHKDFGAKKALYEALLASGIHVVVVRPGKLGWKRDQQIALLVDKVKAIVETILEAESVDEHIMVRVTPTDVKKRTLEDLVNEINGN